MSDATPQVQTGGDDGLESPAAPAPVDVLTPTVVHASGLNSSGASRYSHAAREKEREKHELMATVANTSTQASNELRPDVIKADVALLQARLAKLGAGLLNPRSKLMQYWDFVTIAALLFTATITPYEVCLLWDDVEFATLVPSGAIVLFTINWIVNLIFIVDIVFNFFLPYKESVKNGGGTVKSHRKIAARYLKGWFPIDIISVIPFDNIMMGVDTSGISNPAIFSMIRMLRLLRLIKLARILRASRIFSRWENSISMSSADLSLLKFMVLIAIVIHWFACTLGMMAQLMGAVRTPELEAAVAAELEAGQECYGCAPSADPLTAPVCVSTCFTDCELELLAGMQIPGAYSEQLAERVNLLASEQNWVCRYAKAGKVRPPTYHGELWVAGLYVAMIQLGGGVGSIVPENFAEYFVFFVCIVLGSVLWAMVVGTICATLATGDPHTILFKQNMDALNYFLEDMNMPQELRMRAREYMRNTRELIKRSSYNELVEKLSPGLRSDIVMVMSARTLETVWYLREIEKDALVDLAVKLGRSGYAPREKISGTSLNILLRGVAAKAGNILTPVTTWGEDIIVTTLALRDRRTASALTYVEVATLSRDTLDEVLDRFPDSKKVVQQAAIKIAMQRAILIVSEYLKRQREMRNPGGGLSLAARVGEHMRVGSLSSAPEVLEMLTGKKLKEVGVDDVAEVSEMSPGRSASPVTPVVPNAQLTLQTTQMSTTLASIERRLENESEQRTRLAEDVQEMKEQLKEISRMLRATTLPGAPSAPAP
jgi:hypothetical protein